jgi:tetratricopeptide (TPR) repeat protein
MIYHSKGNDAKALEQYNKCLGIKIKIKGPDSIDVATTLNNIGNVYWTKGDFAKALENYNKCFDIETKIKGPDSIDVATTLNNIGMVH